MESPSKISEQGTEKKRAIIVMGMHRSGTSALTRVINLAGADLPSNLLDGKIGNNEKGFWESKDLMELHDELLKTANSSWDDMSGLSASWFNSDIALSYKSKVLEILKRDFSASPLFVLKDPRMCRLVPFWLSVLDQFGAEPLFVFTIRNPLEVAGSLKARDGFFPAKSFLLWLRHFLDSEFHTRGYKRCFISYEALLKDWNKELTKIGEQCEIIWPRLSHQTTVEVEEFLSFSLRHNHSTNRDLNSRQDITVWLKQAYEWTENATENKEGPLDLLDGIRLALQSADTAYGPLFAAYQHEFIKSCNEVTRLNKKIEETTAEMDRVKKFLEDEQKDKVVLTDQVLQLNAKNADLEQEKGNLHTTLAEVKKSLEDGQNDKAVLTDQINQLNTKNAGLEQEKGNLHAQLAEVKKSLEDGRNDKAVLTDQVNQLNAKIADLAQEKETLHTQLSEVKKSLEDGQNDRVALTDQINQLNTKNADLEQEKGTLHTKLAEVKKSLEDDQKDKVVLTDQLNQLNAKNADLEQVNKTLQTQLLETDKIKSGAEQLKSEKAQLQQELQNIRIEFEQYGVERDQAMQMVKQLQVQVDMVSTELNEMQSKLKQTQIEKKRLEDREDDLLTEIRTSKTKMEDLTVQRDELLEINRQAEVWKKITKSELEQSRFQVKDLLDQIKKLSSELEEKRLQGHMAATELDSSNKKIDDLSKKMDVRFSEIAKLTKLLHEANSKNSLLESELDRIIKDVSEVKLTVAKEIGKIIRSLQHQDGKLIRFLLKRHHKKVLERTGIVNGNWYLEYNHDVALKNVDPFFHYLRYGSYEGREPNRAIQELFSKILDKQVS